MRICPGVFLLSTALVAACGGDDGPEPVVNVDAAVAVDASTSVTVPIKGDRAAFLAARVGRDPWQKLTADASGDVGLAVDRPFEMVGVCPDSGTIVTTYAGGVEDANIDPDAYDIGCGSIETVPLTVNYTGPGEVFVSLGFNQIALDATAPPRPTFASPGVHDVVVIDRVGHQIAIRRGVTITSGMALTVDLTGAVPMVAHPIAGAPATATVSSTLYTANGSRALLAQGDTTGWTVPAALATAGDNHLVVVSEQDTALPRRRSRSVRVDPANTAPIAITLPPHLASATLSWARVPSATYVATGEWHEASIIGYAADAPLWFAHQYPHAAKTPGVMTVPDASAVPGWNPAWNVDPSGPVVVNLYLTREVADGLETVSWERKDELPDGPDMPRAKAARASRADRVERLRADRF